jgi:DNA repair protein RecN (Recombination protein N)
MLKSLKVKNYALIQDLRIDFENDFSTLTGETGAGKSILLGALSLVLGARADSVALGNSDEKCVVEAEFWIKNYELSSFFHTHDLDYEPETIIRREILSNGKSRAFINDSPVNLQLLKDLSVQLIDIHSQHENLELNNNLFQLKVLDAIAQNKLQLELYTECFTNYKKQNQALFYLKDEAQKAEADYDYNLFQFNQLNDLNLEQLNQEELENELEVLSNTEEIQQNLGLSFSLLSEGEQNVLDLLKQSKQAFDRIKSYYKDAAKYAERIESAYIDLKDIAHETELHAETLEYNPERAAWVKLQLDQLYAQMQKHQVNTFEELLELKANFESKIQQKESFSIEIEALEKKLAETELKLDQLAAELSHRRREAIKGFTSYIEKQLHELGMPHARFVVAINPLEQFTENGKDRVSFMFSANKNQAEQNISKIASGGEISRLMLSIKALLSKSTSLPTIIFDEIDPGVSGEIADKMADMMKQMANNMQVISITHLPQIAARGKHHYKVYKTENAHSVSTQIQKLNADDRIVEIAKMLSGKDLTKEAIENAKTLMLS